MFTGLIETVGEVVESTRRAGTVRLGIAAPLPLDAMTRGESVAVDGVCLTVVELRERRFGFDVIPETLDRTTLGRILPGSRVNLERALCMGDRLGGHLVQGHVDAMVTVRAVRRSGGDYRLVLDHGAEIARYVAFKGSVALQGVSLTVAAVDRTGFEVALIPETLERTTLGQARAGDRLNVEVDLLARYLERMLEVGRPEGRPARARGNHD